ncbi:MAG: DUF1592 domain-containing protein [Nannocystaceae bacterium]|nr:DUF1592 domain-containing protein [Nannocystaceae bacterium]
MPALVVLTGCRGDRMPGSDDESGTSGGGSGTEQGDDLGEDETGSSDGADEGTDDGEPSSCLNEPSVAEAPLRRFTRRQYANAVRDLMGIAADTQGLDDDEKAGPFDANVTAPVSGVTVEQYRALAEAVGLEAMAKVEDLVACDPAEATCADSFIVDFGRRAYRRPLTAEQSARYLALMDDADTFEDGVRMVVTAMLQSPNFLYVVETSLPDPGSDNIAVLDGYELASRLSLFLWNSIPDPELLDAARDGALDTPEGLRDEALRLLTDTRARDAVASFHTQWLGVDELEHTTKSTELFPEWSVSMRAAMENEMKHFAQAVVLQGDGKLETLLSADFSYIEDPLFELYGVDKPSGHTVGDPVAMDPTQRAGLLTHAGFLAAHAHPDQSGPIQRGVAVRTNLLCTPPPPPPPDVDAIPPSPDPMATTREIFEQHTADPACAGCHVLIDGIGLGFEGYDAIGAYRATENGPPVDQTGAVVGSDVDGEFDGAVELANMLATSEDVRSCVARQWFRYAFGRIEDPQGDACSLEVLDAAFAESDYNVRELMVALVQTDAFRYRYAN